MKRQLLIGVLVALPLLGFAQFKMKPQTHGFRPEQQNPMVLTKYVDPGEAGRNVTWDFRDLDVGNNFVGNINKTVNTQCFTTFAGANAVLEEFGNMFVFNATERSLEQVGFMSKNGSTVIKYKRPFVKMRYPFTYKSSFSGEFEGEYIFNNRTIGSLAGVYTVRADARGTLLLPANRELKQVLRVKEIKNFDQIINGNRVNFETVTYRWYVENHPFPVLVLISDTYNTPGGRTQTTHLAAYNSHVVTPETNKSYRAEPQGFGTMTVYPNPYKEQVHINFTLAQEANVNLAIYDITGKLVKQLFNGKRGAGQAQFVVAASDLGLGQAAFIVRLEVDGKVTTRKIIAQ